MWVEVCVCVYVCERERDRDREIDREPKRKIDRDRWEGKRERAADTKERTIAHLSSVSVKAWFQDPTIPTSSDAQSLTVDPPPRMQDLQTWRAHCVTKSVFLGRV